MQFIDLSGSGVSRKRGYPYSHKLDEEFLNVLFDFDSYKSQYHEAVYYARDTGVNLGYITMRFDKTGSVVWRDKDFPIDKKRWNHILQTPTQKDFDIFFTLLRKLQNISTRPIIVAFSPCRKVLRDAAYQQRVQYVDRYFRDSLPDIPFFNNTKLDFSDSLFADYIHLSHKGSLRYTDTLIKQIRPYLKDIPRGKSCQ